MSFKDINYNVVDSTVTKERTKYDKIPISYSQLSSWSACPLRWKLRYIDKNREYVPTIHAVFGTAFHETLQHYLKILYDHNFYTGDLISFDEVLMTQMLAAYNDEYVKYGKHFSTKEEIKLFHSQGIVLLNYIRKNREKYFPSNRYKLYGIEIPIFSQVSDENGEVYMTGFIDLVLYDVLYDRFLVVDIKTSTAGWYKYKLQDTDVTAQVLLYKHFLSKERGIPLDKIDTKYFIVKRDPFKNQWEKGPVSYIQTYDPETEENTTTHAIDKAKKFVEICFNDDGTYNTTTDYLPNPGDKMKNCKFCDYKDRDDLCPIKDRM
jgi:hypothetical protein